MNVTGLTLVVKTVTTRAKAFAGRGVEPIRARVMEDGTVQVWDAVAGHYTRCHSLGKSAMRRIRKQAE